MNKVFSFILLTLVLVSCGADSGHFRIEGHLLNLNQGEFYVYSTDGAINSIDTIHVRAGRFSYETPCTSPGTLVIIFPNYSELPIFSEPGKTVSLKGDATHLRELTIKGTDENKLMSTFRELTNQMSPPEIKKQVQLFVGDYPESLAAIYLVQKYYLQQAIPDYSGALSLLNTIKKAQPENGRVEQLVRQISNIDASSVGKHLPAFSVQDIYGKPVTSQSLCQGDAVIYLLALWDFEGLSIAKTLQNNPAFGKSLHLFGICLNASKKECHTTVERNNLESPVYCDEQMFDSPLVHTLGFTSTPQNIILHNGIITDRNLTQEEIFRKFQQ